MKIAFTAYGVPQAQGSMRGTLNRHTGRVVTFHSANKEMRIWRTAVGYEAKKAIAGAGAIDGPLALRVRFVLERPQSAPRTRRFPNVKPDLDKMIRAICDALSGIVYVDDARIIEISASKQYGAPARAEVEVFPL